MLDREACMTGTLTLQERLHNWKTRLCRDLGFGLIQSLNFSQFLASGAPFTVIFVESISVW